MTSPSLFLPALQGPWPERFSLFAAPLALLFTEMDRCYAAAAAAYGFACQGCRDNCCRSRFYHHTLLEVLYLARGFETLPLDGRDAVRQRAREAVQPGAARPMCPFNLEGHCQVYLHRPMICRLHGIPSELALPGQPPQRSSGCDTFAARCGTAPYRSMDRGPHYAALARLESQWRTTLGFHRRLRLTIAEIVCAWTAGMETARENGTMEDKRHAIS